MTLLCLCIVFVPMFQLGGVAGYLFRPMAEAVVFALVGSFLLSRTLVPTMANYLMRGHHGGARIPSARAADRRATRSSAFSGHSRPGSRGSAALSIAAVAGARRTEDVHRRLPRLRHAFIRALAVPGREFLSGGRFRADPDARPRPARHAHRGDGAAVRSRRANRPPARFRPISSTTSSTISACPFPASTWPTRTPARSGPRTATR